MMRKWLLMALACAVGLTVLAGCGSKKSEKAGTTDAAGQAAMKANMAKGMEAMQKAKGQ